MDGKGHRCADTGPLHPLVVIKCTPLGAAVDEIIINDKATALADQFCPLIVMDKLASAALGTDCLGVVLGFLLCSFCFVRDLSASLSCLEGF